MKPPPTRAEIRILVGVDGTPHSERALSWAIGTCRRMGAQLLALHVCDEPALTGLSLTLAGISRDAEATLVDQLRHDVTSQLDDTGIDWAFDACVGDAAGTLERVAEEVHADLIVVGSPSRWHLLSVATRLVRRATRPIVVIP